MKNLTLFFLFVPFFSFSQNNYITNKEYNEFVTYVKDSLLRLTMGKEVDEEYYVNMEHDGNYKNWKFKSIKWEAKLDVNTPWAREALEPWYYEPIERLNRKREFDTRKFIHNNVSVYPNVLIWCRDSTLNKSWATFLSKYYFIHPYFKDYPVYGLSENQIKEYIKWKFPNKEKTFNVSNKIEINLILPKEKIDFTVGEYFKFYKYTRDSIARMILCEELDEYKYCLSINKYNEIISPPIVKWKYKIKWNYEAEYETLTKHNLLNSEMEVDNRTVNYKYIYLDYYKAITFSDSTNRNVYFHWISVNLGANDYIDEFLPINIKKQLKNNKNVDYKKLDIWQLKGFYYWKKSKYPCKDVFDGLIPFDSDIELIRKGLLINDFYNFKIFIPTIQLK